MILVFLLYRGLSQSRKPERYKKQYNYQPHSIKQQMNSVSLKDIPIPMQEVSLRPVIPPELVHFHLISLKESDQKTMEQIVKITQSIPRPHPMLHSLSKGVDDSEELYQLVKSDPVIAAKILQTVNSASIYLTHKITRLNHAILYLGTIMIKNIALQCVISTNMPTKDKQLNLAFEKIWANGFLASSLAFIFAKNLGFENAAELATQTLLTYIGNLAIITYQPQLAYIFSEKVSLFERVRIEQQELGTHSALVGSQLALEWKLPQEIIEGIRNNLIPLGVVPEQCELQGENLRNIVLCYVCCRTSELIMDKELNDIADVNLLDDALLELFYLPEYVRMAELQQIFTLLHKPAVRNEANKLIQKIGGPSTI